MRADFPPRAPPVTGGGRERRPAPPERREGPHAQRGGARQGERLHPEDGEGEDGETQEAAGEGEGRGREGQVRCRWQGTRYCPPLGYCLVFRLNVIGIIRPIIRAPEYYCVHFHKKRSTELCTSW